MLRSATTNRGNDASRLSASLQTLFGAGTLCGLTDGQLLERFLRGRGDAEAEAAFTAMVERHGPMVLKVCEAILGDRHDAEDACQATFLVLARRAGTIRRGDSVASWLYGVARRIAARARRDLARRRALERRRLERAGSTEPVSAPASEPWPELYEELDRLPEPFRAAVVLCDLEGHSYEQAAGLLRCPLGTLQSRLARGRERLRHRLERRGIAPAVVLIGSGADPSALSPPLTAAIARSAVGIGSGRTIAGSAPAAVAAMAGAELRRQVMSRALTTLTTLVMAGLMATAAIGLAAGGRGDDPKSPTATAVKNNVVEPIHVRVVDLQGRGIPAIAVEVREGDRPGSFATDADGRAAIPRDLVGERGFLIARRGSEALAWGRAERREAGSAGRDLRRPDRDEAPAGGPSRRGLDRGPGGQAAARHPGDGLLRRSLGQRRGLLRAHGPGGVAPADRYRPGRAIRDDASPRGARHAPGFAPEVCRALDRCAAGRASPRTHDARAGGRDRRPGDRRGDRPAGRRRRAGRGARRASRPLPQRWGRRRLPTGRAGSCSAGWSRGSTTSCSARCPGAPMPRRRPSSAFGCARAPTRRPT